MPVRDATPLPFNKDNQPQFEDVNLKEVISPFNTYNEDQLEAVERTLRVLTALAPQVASKPPDSPLRGWIRYAIDPWHPLGSTAGDDGWVYYDGSAWVDLIAGLFTSSAAGTVPASGGGTSNFLRADGSWAAPSSGGFATLLDTQSPSGGANCDFSSISSSYDDLLFEIYGLSHDNGAAQNFRVAFSDDNGSTFKNITGMARGSSSVSTSATTPLSLLSGTVNSSTTVFGHLWVRNYKATDNGLVHGVFTSSTGALNENATGFISKATALNMVRFNFAAGNFDAGTVKLYGLTRS